MDDDELQALRRQRLKAWIDANGGAHAVCARKGLKRSAESYISQVINGHGFSGKGARNMEKRLGMDAGYLDGAPTNAQPAPELSVFAMQLAKMYDRITDEVERTIAYNAAMGEILKVLREHEPPPTGKPTRPVKPKKQRA